LKKLFAIYHGVDEDGGFGDAVYTEIMVGLVYATDKQIKDFVEQWDKPIVYDKPYAELMCHSIRAEEIPITKLTKLNPYGKDDYYGKRAREYEARKQLKEKYGDFWFNNHEAMEIYKKERLGK
jgi:hypothetical protein